MLIWPPANWPFDHHSDESRQILVSRPWLRWDSLADRFLSRLPICIWQYRPAPATSLTWIHEISILLKHYDSTMVFGSKGRLPSIFDRLNFMPMGTMVCLWCYILLHPYLWLGEFQEAPFRCKSKLNDLKLLSEQKSLLRWKLFSWDEIGTYKNNS